MMKIFTDYNIWLPHGWEFLPGWSLQFGVSSDHTGWIQIGLDGNGPWRIRSGREEKQKGNQQSGELAELVDSIGRSLPGLVFLSIFINGMKMQRNTPTKQRGKNRKANNSAKPRGKKIVFLCCLNSTWISSEHSGHPTFWFGGSS